MKIRWEHKREKNRQTETGETAASPNSRISSRPIYNAPPLCPKLPFVEYPGNRQWYVVQLPPPCYAIGRGVARGARCPTAQGFRISISRVLLVIHSLFHTSTAALSFSSFPSLPPTTVAHSSNNSEGRGWEGGEAGRKGSPGSPSQSPGAEDIHQSNKHTHMHLPPIRNFARTAAPPQPSNFTIFLPFLLIPRRLRGFTQLQFRKYAILSSLREMCFSTHVCSCEMLRKFDENDKTISMLLSLSNHLSRSLHGKSHRI